MAFVIISIYKKENNTLDIDVVKKKSSKKVKIIKKIENI